MHVRPVLLTRPFMHLDSLDDLASEIFWLLSRLLEKLPDRPFDPVLCVPEILRISIRQMIQHRAAKIAVERLVASASTSGGT